MTRSTLESRVGDALGAQRGVVRARPAIVFRDTYTGRGVLGDNRAYDSSEADARGYLPVEWWIMSLTVARNNDPRPGEGRTELLIDDEPVPLDVALDAAGAALFGAARPSWPLIKLLDIGGDPVVPDFAPEAEVPPIPVHVHGGTIENGRARRPGKLEAYFFPPLDVAGLDLGPERVRTRLGLAPGVSRDEFERALALFGQSDRMYALLQEFDVAPFDGWIIRPGILHAPGPWPTVEVQTPQDDFNLASWQLGQRIPESRRAQEIDRFVLRGLPDLASFANEVVDWDASRAEGFRDRAYRPARVIDEGAWGCRWQTFFDEFDGEAVAVSRGCSVTLRARDVPQAFAVWAGEGAVNGLAVGARAWETREVLVAPGHAITLDAASSGPLWIFSFAPIRPNARR